MNKIFFINVVVAVCLAGSLTMSETYSCNLKDSRNSGWVPDRMVFAVDRDAKTVKVYDPITFSTLKKTALADVQTLNPVRIAFGWATGRFENTKEKPSRDNPNPGPKKIQYRATFLQGGEKILLKAYPGGTSDPASGRGSCQITDKPLKSFAE